MEFNEKLQELRKNKGLTQEELAEALYVSRTTISKWESGRGYPNIDSLKEISKFFSVTIDELLSGEKLLSIAEKENKANLQRMCSLLFGIVDLFSFMLIVLPLYPNPINGYIYSVNLFSYTDTAFFNIILYWVSYLALIVMGITKIALTQLKTERGQSIITSLSLGLSILTVLYLGMAREAYAITVAFMLLLIKGILLLKYTQNS